MIRFYLGVEILDGLPDAFFLLFDPSEFVYLITCLHDTVPAVPAGWILAALQDWQCVG